MDAGEGGDRAGGAQQMELRAAGMMGHRPREGRERVAGEVRHRREGVGAHMGAAEMLREGDDAKLQRCPVAQLHGAAPRAPRAGEPHEFCRAAADVEQQHARRLPVDQRTAAARGEARLGLAVDDLQLQAGVVAHAGGEFVAVAGAAAGLRRDGSRPRDAARVHFVAANFQRLERAVDRLLADAAVAAKALAQPNDAGEGVDDAQHLASAPARPPLGPRDQQATVVRAKVERGVKMFAIPGADLRAGRRRVEWALFARRARPRAAWAARCPPPPRRRRADPSQSMAAPASSKIRAAAATRFAAVGSISLHEATIRHRKVIYTRGAGFKLRAARGAFDQVGHGQRGVASMARRPAATPADPRRSGFWPTFHLPSMREISISIPTTPASMSSMNLAGASSTDQGAGGRNPRRGQIVDLPPQPVAISITRTAP